MKIYGYHKKILHVNLTKKEVKVEQPNELFYRRYVGSGIMGAYYLLKKTQPKVDSLSPENLLMFMSSVVAGYEAPGLAQFVVAGKSPLTEGIGEARSEGPFGIALKKSGYDGIVISGRSKIPSILVIEDGEVSIKETRDLWGKDVGEVTDQLKEEYVGSSVATIGKAGENLVRFANIVSEKNHSASRSGMGALMGSKNLKAVVLKDGNFPEVAEPLELKNLYNWYEKRMKHNELAMWQHDAPGFGVWIHTHGLDAALCVNNYQTAKFPTVDNYAEEKFLTYYRGEVDIPGCPMNIIKKFSVEPKDAEIGGIHQEAVGALGPNLGITDIKKVIHANILCNKYGIDPNSLGYTISFFLECLEKGTYEHDETITLGFGDELDLLQLIEMIAERRGIGDLLAEGSARAAERIGGTAKNYALTVKNNEVVPFEPRSQSNLALGYAVSPTGPRYDICEHDWDYDLNYGWEHSLDNSRTVGILERIPMEYIGRDKVKNFKALNTIWSAADGLSISLFSTAPTRVYSLEDMAKVLRIITGWETSSYEVMRIGELRNHIYRFYNCREGFTSKDDGLPNRFYESEIDAGVQEGVKIDRNKFEDSIKFYYQMMGWDEEGCPLLATLYDYGLNELI